MGYSHYRLEGDPLSLNKVTCIVRSETGKKTIATVGTCGLQALRFAFYKAIQQDV